MRLPRKGWPSVVVFTAFFVVFVVAKLISAFDGSYSRGWSSLSIVAGVVAAMALVVVGVNVSLWIRAWTLAKGARRREPGAPVYIVRQTPDLLRLLSSPILLGPELPKRNFYSCRLSSSGVFFGASSSSTADERTLPWRAVRTVSVGEYVDNLNRRLNVLDVGILDETAPFQISVGGVRGAPGTASTSSAQQIARAFSRLVPKAG